MLPRRSRTSMGHWPPPRSSPAWPPGLRHRVDLPNNTGSNTVYAYVTGLAIDNDNAWYPLQADGQTLYYRS